MGKIIHARHKFNRHSNRKYTDEQIQRMEEMRAEGMSVKQISIQFDTKKKDIEQQLGRFGSMVDTRGALKVPYTPGLFDFRGMDVCN